MQPGRGLDLPLATPCFAEHGGVVEDAQRVTRDPQEMEESFHFFASFYVLQTKKRGRAEEI